MVYSNEELTQRIKQLEDLVLDLMGQQVTRGMWRVGGICVNTMLHSPHMHREESDTVEHPVDLDVPHWIWQPQIDWGRDLIHLHPDNKPSA